MTKEMIYTPDNDGITHINAYSKGRTELGRQLTNFAHTPFNHTDYGPFESVEGLWYWLKTGKVNNELRDLSGFAAKRRGRELVGMYGGETVGANDAQFQEDIKEGTRCKLRQNQHILKSMIQTDLPFVHYYWKGDIKDPVITPCPEVDWLMEELERVRDVTKQWLQQKEKDKKKFKNRP